MHYTLRGDRELELREVNSHSDREFGLEAAFRLDALPWPSVYTSVPLVLRWFSLLCPRIKSVVLWVVS